MYAAPDLQPYRGLHAVTVVHGLLRRWWGLELRFADGNGRIIDRTDGERVASQNSLCRDTLLSPVGAARCADAVKALLAMAREAGPRAQRSILAHTCHLGFDLIGSPLWFGEDLAGMVFCDGSVGEPLTAEAATAVAAEVAALADRPVADVLLDVESIPVIDKVDRARLRQLVGLAGGEVIKHWRSQAKGPAEIPPGADDHPFSEIVGRAPAVRELVTLLAKVVKSHATVLVHGESGTGKELIARAIHYHGPRAKGPFVVQNCSAFNDNLLESALFGHVRGAFTGAVANQKGLFEVADGGTFFLDEIGDMSAALQVKLLRVLQESTFTPVGGTKPVKVDVRIIAASHKDLAAMVARREFREDLYYRVNVLKIVVPPLRERAADIPLLVRHFLRKHARGGVPQAMSARALDALVRYPWPGNIRELENEIERALVLGGGEPEVPLEVLSPRLIAAAAAQEPDSHPPIVGTLRAHLEAVEAEVILHGLIRTHWDTARLANELGISVTYLLQKCVHHGLAATEPTS